MHNMSRFDTLMRQRQELQLASEEVSRRRTELTMSSAAYSKQLISEFSRLKEILYETETSVLDAVKSEYKQKLTELDALERQILRQVQQLDELTLLDSPVTVIPDMSVDFQLSDFELVAADIRNINVIKRTSRAVVRDLRGSNHGTDQLRPQVPTSVPSGGFHFQFGPLLAGNQPPTTPTKRAAGASAKTTACAAPKPKIVKLEFPGYVPPISGQEPAASVVVDDPDGDDEDSITSGGTGGGAQTSAAGSGKMRAQVRDFICCVSCSKPRCLYSQKVLTPDQKKLVEGLKMSCTYKCGTDLHAPTRNFPQDVSIEDNIDCKSDVHSHYYFPPLKFPVVCYKCGSRDCVVEASDADKLIYSSFHPVCACCYAAGCVPRTHKKKSKKN